MATPEHPAMKHVVPVSGGKDSTSLALALKDRHPDIDFIYVCTPTGDEPDEMFEHWNAMGVLLGKRFLPIMNKEGALGHHIDKWNSLPSRRQRWCTRLLKIEPFRDWLSENAPAVVYVGLRADEEGRAGGAYDDIDGVEIRYPLREWGWTVDDVLTYLAKRGVNIPRRTDCETCFWQQVVEWYRLWRDHRAKFLLAVEREARTGQTHRVPKLDENGSPVLTTRWKHKRYAASWRDSWPVRLADMAELWELGYLPKNSETQPDMMRAVGPCRVCTL